MNTGFPQKYCPSKLDGFVGIDRIVKILKHLAANPRESAFLFLGSPGLGKTSLGLALCQELGAQLHHIPSSKCDLEAVDALCYSCNFVPMFGVDRFHVCVIDEADRMSKAAQLAFLSKLDGSAPPPKTIFIFTANETTLLEDRFLSRCRILEWPTPSKMLDSAVELFKKIWKAEGHSLKNAPDFAQMFIASGYDFRAALNTLELEVIAPSEDEEGSAPIDPSALSKLYSLGAETYDPSEVRDICKALGVTAVIHCLGTHFKRLVDHRRAIESAAIRFIDRPGLRTFPPAAEDLRWLRKLTDDNTVLLLGTPEAPGACRRHVQIAVPMLKKGIDCVHVFQDQLIKASDLQLAIETGKDDSEFFIPFPQGKAA